MWQKSTLRNLLITKSINIAFLLIVSNAKILALKIIMIMIINNNNNNNNDNNNNNNDNNYNNNNDNIITILKGIYICNTFG